MRSGLYYRDQKRRHGAYNRLPAERVPKFLGYFESVCRAIHAATTTRVGAKLSYVDLSLFQVIAGMSYAFRSP